MPSLIGDKICAMAMVGAVSAALFRRERTGEGQMVEVPMLETIAGFNSIEMLGGHAFDPPIGPTGYKRMKNRRPEAGLSDAEIETLVVNKAVGAP